MRRTIAPASSISGEIGLPGDKSISHRYAMIAAIAEGETRIRNYSTGADCHSTLGCLRALGIEISGAGTEFVIRGRGLDGLRAPSADLDAGNSGSTIRMLSGILAAQPFRSRIFGDESLSRRPMQRVIAPLAQMGARIGASEGKYPPLEIDGGALRPIHYALPVASAQVKTCVLLAGLFAEGRTSVTEPARSRDHTEIALREFGAEVVSQRSTGSAAGLADGDLDAPGDRHHPTARAANRITVTGRPRLAARELYVPSDLSSAAFFIAAALLIPGSHLVIRGVGLNPTRSALLDFLTGMGAKIRVPSLESCNGELIGDVEIEYSELRGGTIEGPLTAALIDEIPVLAVVGAASEEGLVVKDAAELRVKETDRIRTVVENLRRMGVEAEELPDGMVVPGRRKFRAARFESFGDHRIAMAFAVAGLRCDGESIVENAEAASVSFPEFWRTLDGIAKGPI